MSLSISLKRHAVPLAVAAAGAVAAGTLFAYSADPTAAAAEVPSASARLIKLTIADVDALNTSAFTGSYGIAGTPPLGQDGSGDFSDPDGVLNYASFGTEDVRTSNTTAKVYAQVHAAAVSVHIHPTSAAASPLIGFGPVADGATGDVDTYAECVPPPY